MILALGFLWISLGAPAHAAGGPKLFGESAAPVPASREAHGHLVLRSRAVTVDLGLLTPRPVRPGEKQASQPRRIELDLFPDASWTAVLDSTESALAGTSSWIGHLEGIEGGLVVLTSSSGVLVGSVTLPTAAYRVRYTRAGIQVVEEVDRTAFAPDAEPIVPPAAKRASGPTQNPTVADDGSTIDVLEVYSPAARANAGGTAAIQALIAQGIAETNLAYSNSGIIPRLRLVHTEEVSYTDSRILQTDLTRLQNPSDGFLDGVLPLRNTYGADVVQLVVGGSDDGFCGQGYLMNGSNNTGFQSSAYSVVDWDCISPNYSFGHEIGHNLGCNHAPSDPGLGTGAFSYSFGYKDPSNRFRTMMAYDCSPSCTRVLYFSNPGVFYLGSPTGTSTQNNAQSINNVRSVVANFRQATVQSEASANAASFSTSSLAAESIVSAFGSVLATTTQSAPAPPPTSLGGTTVSVRDSGGTDRLAPLFYVSPGQVNYEMPAGTANGTATITITNGSGQVSIGSSQITTVAPGLFTANGNGLGVLSANLLRIHGDGSQVYEVVAQWNGSQYVPLPISFGPSTDTLYLILYGTGVRSRSSLGATGIQVGGTNPSVFYAGAQGTYLGEDQINVGPLSRGLAGAGTVNVTLTVDGQSTNTGTLAFQ
jgi:uncharacterized protein (TIGR03437 family)